MYGDIKQRNQSIVKMINDNPKILENRNRFTAFLADCIPDNKALRLAMVCAYNEGLLDLAKKGLDSKKTIFQCCRILENECGISEIHVKSAVELVLAIAGKDEWAVDFCDKNLDETRKQKPDCKENIDLQLKYTRTDKGVLISDIEITLDEIPAAKRTVVVPEKIDDLTVIGVLPGALNLLRKCRIRAILLPNTIRAVGEKTKRLYDGFSEKGVFKKPLLFIANDVYCKCLGTESFYEVFGLHDRNELFGYEMDIDDLDPKDFISLKQYQDEDDNWFYPEDGFWITDDCLYRYTGDETEIIVTGCVSVMSDVFKKIPVKSIVFDQSVRKFSTGMIHDCSFLEQIIFEAKICDFSDRAIYNCVKLSRVSWPYIRDYNHISIYDSCPCLGNMIINRTLLTYQKDEELIILDDDLECINNRAFASCHLARILYVSSRVKKLEENALAESSIEIVVFEGQYTIWKPNGTNMYVFCHKGSTVMNSVPIRTPCPALYIKNIERIKAFLNPLKSNELIKMCYQNMDKTSDDDMVLKPWGWEAEIHKKGYNS